MWKNLQSTEGEIKSESDDLLYYFNKGALSKYKSQIIVPKYQIQVWPAALLNILALPDFWKGR